MKVCQGRNTERSELSNWDKHRHTLFTASWLTLHPKSSPLVELMMSESDPELQVRANVFWKYVACRGYHVYNEVIWLKEDQYPGKQVFVVQETSLQSRASDPYCCAIQIRYEGTYHVRFDTVGHVPREISRFFYFFLEMGGMIEGILVDSTRRRSPIPSGGLEVKLKLYFRHTSVSIVEKLKSCISRYNYEWETQPTVDDADV